MELGAGVAKALLTSAKGTEILSGLRCDIIVKVEVDTTGLICDEVSDCSDAMRPAHWRICFNGKSGAVMESHL